MARGEGHHCGANCEKKTFKFSPKKDLFEATHLVCAVCSLSSFEEGGGCVSTIHALDIKLGTINQKGFFSTPSTPESFYEADVVE